MNKYYYDFHIHSCLSPCGDDDMTPNNICGMAVLGGLNIIALTDHNSSKNCPAFFEAAKRYGIIPVPGMELTTSEDIHIVCLFEELDDAMSFDEYVETRRVLIENRADIFGNQFILSGEDEKIGEEKYLLINATNISLEEVPALVRKYGGVCYPAHIDREANGIIATLGTFPQEPHFDYAEFNDSENQKDYTEKYPVLEGKRFLVSSDAHYLWHMREKEAYLEIEDEPYSSKNVRHNLFKLLRGE